MEDGKQNKKGVIAMEIIKLKIDDLVFDPNNVRFFKRISIKNDCWEFKDIQPHTGYGKYHVNGVTWRAHRWVLYALGKIERNDKRCVLHECDNRSCVNPKHLKLGDRYDNAQDIKKRCRTHLISDPKLGEKNPQAKLSNKDVKTIKKLLEKGHRGIDLANKYAISRAVISEIKNGKLWRHI